MSVVLDSDRLSVLLIATDDRSGQTVEVLPCDGVTPALEHIANAITHPEEDYAVSLDVLSAAWSEHVEQGGYLAEFTFARHYGGIARDVTFSLFPSDRIGKRWEHVQ